MTDHTHIPPAAPDPLPPAPTDAPPDAPTAAPTHAPTHGSAPSPAPSPTRRWGVVGGVAVLLLAALLFMLVRRPAVTPAPTPRTGSPAVSAPESSSLPLAETAGEEGHLTIGVVSLDRVAADTLELRLAVTNTNGPGSPALDIAQRFSADGPDRGTLAEVYLADLSHEHKFFVLRDGANVPLGSRDLTPLAAGERRVLWARYPAPGDADVEVVVHVPHAEPLPNVPVGKGRAEP